MVKVSICTLRSCCWLLDACWSLLRTILWFEFAFRYISFLTPDYPHLKNKNISFSQDFFSGIMHIFAYWNPIKTNPYKSGDEDYLADFSFAPHSPSSGSIGVQRVFASSTRCCSYPDSQSGLIFSIAIDFCWNQSFHFFSIFFCFKNQYFESLKINIFQYF